MYTAGVDDDVLRLTYEYESMAEHVPPEASIEHLRGVERASNQLSFVITPPGPPADLLDPLADLALLFLVLVVGAGIEVVRRVRRAA